ncbi:hypothetical protein OG709_31355 [Streptomyces sp. NBC_01267]|uniref:hypothetical protein n=1 Tax=Streptomyces sp. NBC_01267 TaxID=2903805 RepID=UPI002E376C82|nr:hypothetical protein [Streptomyces sp. NBC_01267]
MRTHLAHPSHGAHPQAARFADRAWRAAGELLANDAAVRLPRHAEPTGETHPGDGDEAVTGQA